MPGHDGQQHLGGADVGGGLLAADVLLAGLQGRGGRAGCAVGVDCETPTSRPGSWRCEASPHGHVAGVRAAEAHRHAEALRRGRRRRRRRARPARRAGTSAEQVGGDDGERALRRGRPRSPRSGRRGPAPEAPGYWTKAPNDVDGRRVGGATRSAVDELDAERPRPGARSTRDASAASASASTTNTLRLRPWTRGGPAVIALGRGGGLVEHRRVGRCRAR